MIHAIVLFTIIPVHEWAHGYVAYKLGDDTAYYQGRLTLNPFAHLDPVGTIALLFAGIGWAKPVPINSNRFKNPRRDMALSALAGPVANVVLSLLILIVYKVLLYTGVFFHMGSNAMTGVMMFMQGVISTSVVLAVFNLLPIPPLDGFKIFGSILPNKYYFYVLQNERYIFLILLVLLMTGILSTPIIFLANLVMRLLDFLTIPISWIF